MHSSANSYHDLINALFFQTLEYTMAPMIFVLLIHFLTKKHDKLKSLSDRHVEYSFIALYSNFLYFLSISSHRAHHGDCICGEVEKALLINCIFVAFVLFNNDALVAYAKWFKHVFTWLWAFIMFILLILIIVINLHVFGFEISLKDFCITFSEMWKYFFSPTRILLLFFMVGGFGLTCVNWRSQYKSSTIDFQDYSQPSIKDAAALVGLLKIADNVNSNPKVRVQAYYKISEYYLEKQDLENALIYINQSKAIALMIPYPAYLIEPIIRLRIEILRKLGKEEDAELEEKDLNNN